MRAIKSYLTRRKDKEDAIKFRFYRSNHKSERVTSALNDTWITWSRSTCDIRASSDSHPIPLTFLKAPGTETFKETKKKLRDSIFRRRPKTAETLTNERFEIRSKQHKNYTKQKTKEAIDRIMNKAKTVNGWGNNLGHLRRDFKSPTATATSYDARNPWA